MLAIVCRKFGTPDDLVAEEMPSPVAGPGEVVMAVKAISMSMANVLVIANNHPHPRPTPFFPGSEACGVVKSIGPDVDSLKVGDAVIGRGVNGSTAEEIICCSNQLRRLPADIDFVQAAAAGSYATSLYGLRMRARLQPGEWVLVLGAAGGVGLAAVDLARSIGAHVIACASTEEKRDICRQYGADHVLDYDGEAPLDRRIRTIRPDGVDVVVDPAGGPNAELAVRSMGWDGRFLSIGYPAGVPAIPLNLLLHQRLSLLGMSIRELRRKEPDAAAVIFKDVMDMLVAGTIKPRIHATYPLAKTAQALNDVKDRKVLGKAVVVT